MAQVPQESAPAPLLYLMDGYTSLLGTRKDTMESTIEYLQAHHPQLEDCAPKDFSFEVQWRHPRTRTLTNAVVASDAWATIVTKNPELHDIKVVVEKDDEVQVQGKEAEGTTRTESKKTRKRSAIAMSSEDEAEDSGNKHGDDVKPDSKATQALPVDRRIGTAAS